MTENQKGYAAPGYGYGKYGAAPVDDEIDLAALWWLLLDHWKLIAATTFVAIMLGVLYAELATPIYKANAMVQVENDKDTLPGMTQLSDLFVQSDSAETEIQIIRSRMILGRAVDELLLNVHVTPDSGWFASPHIPGFNQSPEFAAWRGEDTDIEVTKADMPPQYQDQPLKLESQGNGEFRLLDEDGNTLLQGKAGKDISNDSEHISLKLAKFDAPKGTVFDLTVESRLNAIEDIQNNLSVSEQGKETGIIALSYTNASPPRAKAILNAIAQAYREQNVERKAAQAQNSLDFLNKQIPKIKKQLNEAEDKLNQYRTKSDSVDLSLETKSKLDHLVDIETKLNELTIKENQLQQLYTKKHPQYQALLDQRKSLEKEKARINKQIKGLPKTQQEVLRLQRDVEVNQSLYQQLRTNAQDMRVAKAGTVGNVRIVDDALTYPIPVKPKKRLVVILAALLGLIVGIAYVLLKNAFNRSVQSPEVLDVIGLNVYANIPVSRKQQELDKSPALKEKGASLPLLSIDEPHDLTVESIRSLRTSIHFAMMDSFSNVVTFSGPSPGVGKSFLSANLAVVLAQAEKRVILVDADMRKGHLHRYFGDESHPGLSEYLSGSNQQKQVIRKSVYENLDFIPRGTVPPNPAELLMHERLGKLLESLGNQYDLVIVDTPPILAVTDPAIVGQHADTNMLVVRYGETNIKEVEVAKQKFEQNGVKLKGTVLNAMEYSRANVYGYYPYRYGSSS